MNYVTTNIRLSEEDYLRLKEEAAKRRKSFAAIVRERLRTGKKPYPKKGFGSMLTETDKIAKEIGEKLKGFDSVKALREIRYEGKW
jgi:hypothetical protein